MRTSLVALLSFLLLLPTLTRGGDAPRERMELHELWRRGAEDDDLIFGNIDRIVADAAGTVYALDTQLCEVLILSPEGEHLRTIGRRGEGPGEFEQPADLYYGLGDRVGVLQAFPGKIVQLSPDGTPLDNLRLPEQPGGGFEVYLRAHAQDDRLVLAGNRQARSGDQRMQNQFLEAYSPRGELLTRYHEQSTAFQFGGMEYEEPSFVSFVRRWALAPDGRVMAVLSFHDYRIHVWKADGTLDQVVERADHVPLERTDEELETVQQLYDAVTSFNPRSSFEVSPTHPAVTKIFARDSGELWVISDRGMYRTPEGCAMVLDVFDRDGRFDRQIEVAGDLDLAEDDLYLLGDRVYAITGALGSALSSMGGGDEEGEVVDVEPSNIVCFELRAAP